MWSGWRRKVDLKTIGRIADNTGGRKFVPATADELVSTAADLIDILKGRLIRNKR